MFVPIDEPASLEDSAAATRAIATRAEQFDPDIAATTFSSVDREPLVNRVQGHIGVTLVSDSWGDPRSQGMRICHGLYQ